MAKKTRPARHTSAPVIEKNDVQYVDPKAENLRADGFIPSDDFPGKTMVCFGLERGPDGGTCFLHRLVVHAGAIIGHSVRTWDIRAIQVEKAASYLTLEEL
jgi:hypothetical protein